jgi:hypothetical protein
VQEVAPAGSALENVFASLTATRDDVGEGDAAGERSDEATR